MLSKIIRATFLILLFNFFILFQSTAQETDSLCVGRINLSSQSEVDNCPCTEILGYLHINGDDINNLDSLSKIKSISSDLNIKFNPNLKSIFSLKQIDVKDGIHIENNASLTEISGFNITDSLSRIYIKNNPLLESIQGFNSLEYTYFLLIENNPLLNDLSGLVNLETVGIANLEGTESLETLAGLSGINHVIERFSIINNQSLKSISELRNLDKINDLQIIGNSSLNDLKGFEKINELKVLIVSKNSAITNLSGLDSLERVNGYFKISENESMINFHGLEKLKKVDSKLIIEENHKIESLLGFGNLISVGEGKNIYDDKYSLELINNTNLNSIEGFESIEYIDGFSLTGQQNLKNLLGFKNLTTVNYLKIEDNKLLENFLGLEKINRVYGLILKNNEKINSLKGMDSLTGSINDIRIENNPNLADLKCLKAIKTADIFNLKSNPKIISLEDLNSFVHISAINITNNGLQNLMGFNNLKSANYFLIENNKNLKNYLGLEGLESVNNIFQSNNNPNVQTFEGLKNLTFAKEINISSNENLVSLEGLNNLDSLSYLKIADNISLSDVSALTQISTNLYQTNVTNNPQLTECCGISKLVSKTTQELIVEKNGTGCESIKKIKEICPIEPTTCDYDVTLKSQAMVDACNCNTINGSLTIEGGNDFSQLKVINKINRDLIVTGSLNLDGLDSLKTIGGRLILKDSNSKEISGLSYLDSVGVGVSIISCNLNTLDGLKNLKFIGDAGLTIYHTALKNLNGINAPVKSLELSYNDSIESLFERPLFPENVTGELLITENPRLSSLSGLENVKSISGTVQLENLPLIDDFSGLKNIEHMGSLSISYMHHLTKITGLDKLVQIGDPNGYDQYLSISSNDNLEIIEGLDNLSKNGEILGMIYMYDNYNLKDCKRLTKLFSRTKGPINFVNSNFNCEYIFNLENNDIPYSLSDSLGLVSFYNNQDKDLGNKVWDLSDRVENWTGITTIFKNYRKKAIKLDLSNSNLTDTFHIDKLDKLSELRVLLLNENNINHLPYIGRFFLDSLDISNNLLSPKSIERNINSVRINYNYSPQKPIPEPDQYFLKNLDATLKPISLLEGERYFTGASFYWYKDKKPLLQDYNLDFLNINNFSEKDTGTYHYEATFSRLPGLKIKSQPFKVLLKDWPRDILLSDSIINDNGPGTIIGILQTIDYDTLDFHTYELVPNNYHNHYFSISGDSLKIKEILPIDSIKQFRVIIRSIDKFDLTYTKGFTLHVDSISNLFRIAGKISDNEKREVLSWKVLLFEKDSSNIWQSKKEMSLNDTSSFDFNGLKPGEYTLKVIADSSLYVPTYYPNSLTLEDAETIKLTENFLSANITLIGLPGAGIGDKNITGKVVKAEENDGGRITQGFDSGEPIPNVNVYLLSFSTEKLIGVSNTDEKGDFVFGNIENGTYKLRLDLENIRQDLSGKIELSEITKSSNVFALVGDTSVVYEIQQVTGLNDFPKQSFKFYPNPVSRILFLELDNKLKQNGKISLIDLQGREVFDSALKIKNHGGILEVDISSIKKGIYFLKVELDNKSYFGKLLIE